MLDTYDRVTTLLGKSRNQTAQLLLKFIEDLDEKPHVDCNHERIWVYEFPLTGLVLDFDAKYGMFYCATFHISTGPTKSGTLQSYSGSLPFGISYDDSREEIERKLPGGTMEVKDYRFDVDLRPLIVTFHFGYHSPGAPEEWSEELALVSVRFDYSDSF